MPEAPDPIELAARALRHRDRSRRQLDERLERAGVDEERRAAALETLERVGYVDDSRFAVERAAALAGRGYGDEAIGHLLAADGVAAEVAEAAVKALAPERERAGAIARGAGSSAKTAGKLLRKGFGAETVEAVLEAFADVGPEA
ncbi:MAG TPA: RecX family transcriptional regulator [Gaiellaceae bacterium]|nr:RecX family transcriptional regulator [Gaiellaceae bacterium]